MNSSGWFAANKADRLAVEEEKNEAEISPMPGFVRSYADGGPGPNAAPLSKTPLLLLKVILVLAFYSRLMQFQDVGNLAG